ncbi:hypothetical protein UCDDA912_g02322 [Diaporthe ampelina]|uniref:Uncharacterized protein n=1 Tax=Diaporthe ampelina TaxID=1214573 RepID=A0A0G2HS18_9PEZI|nr:hypothetical protein UCDDA912_g02322 [Diaporthe ampelina]
MAKVFSGFDDRNWIAENPLHRALSIRSGRGFSYEFIKFLLDHGYAARIEERSHEGLTPLLIACHAIGDPAQDSVVKLLLQYGRFKAVTQDRIELLDSLLATSTEKDVNTFDVRERTPLTMLINWALLWSDAFDTDTSEMESRLFGKGADIMAGVEMGKVTPFEYMVWKAVGTYHDTPGKRAHVGDKVLALLRGSRINEHPHRPIAMLNQFLGYLDRQLHATGRVLLDMIPFVLHALIKAGFGPAEVDRHGDTAMNSLLQQLLACPYWAVPPNRSLLVSIMALLQEHGAALHQRNNKGYMAFDYLQQIMEYDGESTEHATLARVMSCIVQPGQDEHGNMCLKFHPTKHLFGSLSGDSTLMMIQRNPSRWLVCEHWCRYYCGSSRASDGQCGYKRGTIGLKIDLYTCLDGEGRG